MQCWSAVVFVMAVFLATTKGEINDENRPYRILFLVPISSKSHKNFFMGVASALAHRDNQVTVVSSYRPSKPQKNVEEIVVDFNIDDHMPNAFEGKVDNAIKLITNAPGICVDVLGKKEIQGLLQREFDLVILSVFFSNCLISVIYQMKVPYAWISPAGVMGPQAHFIGNPPFPSFIGFPLLSARHPLSFPQRIQNTLIDTVMGLVFTRYLIPRMDNQCRERKLCPDDMPNLIDLQYNASFMIANSVRTLEIPQPHMPNIILAGGIHCRPSQPLPKDLEDWVQGAGKEGFIFFSLGSVVRPSDMPEKHRQILVKVFGSLKQQVLWKWDQDTMPDLPSNVRLGKWLPQQDILGHPSLRLFITHGGLLSTLESAYHGIPVLGLPVKVDQHANMIQVARDGWGHVIQWNQLTEDTLIDGIQTVMGNQSIKAEAKRRSVLIRDQPKPPAEVASYWIEYVIRHGGAPHLRSPLTTMTWYQVYNVDVWITVIIVAVVATYLFFWVIWRLCRLLCSSRKIKSD